jgi:uncharacterized membrane protein
MAFCASCGAPVEGRFCAKCGATVGEASAAPPPPVGGYAPPAAGYPPPAASYPPPVPPPMSAGMADNAASALCYVLGLITGVLFLVLEPYSKNRVVRFHAFQSIFLNIAVIIIAIAVGILEAVLGHLLGYWLVSIIGLLFNLCMFLLWIYMIVTTYQGRTTVLPIIGPIAQQQA